MKISNNEFANSTAQEKVIEEKKIVSNGRNYSDINACNIETTIFQKLANVIQWIFG